LRDLGAETLGVVTDVGERASVEALAARSAEAFGGAHILFNNAGVAIEGKIAEMSHEDWEWLVRVNLWGVIHGVETFLPRMIEAGAGGHIVNTASFAGLVANDGLGVYCVTKYGVVALSECLYREGREHGIGVSVLCPMRVETHIDGSQRNRPIELGGDPNETIPPPPDPAQFPCETLRADVVAREVVRAIRSGELYILPHSESRAFIARRFQRIDRTFERSEG
ncbi:MAG: SDR family NAD(P)-dependent oxidoreductase, partial [Myxococcales bacterium]|nr:SDR family NAD(P)-dependent oxidoreductase [Myxococcales bacterium]